MGGHGSLLFLIPHSSTLPRPGVKVSRTENRQKDGSAVVFVSA
jgi:hypothetical protein